MPPNLLLEQRAVGRKTPLDGRLELSAASAERLGSVGDELAVVALGREAVGRLETMECTCGKQPGARPGERHVHHFVASALFKGLAAGDPVRLELDPERRALLVERTPLSEVTPLELDAAPAWPISYADVLASRERIAPFLAPTPLRAYPQLDERVGGGTTLLVKHEHHQPTCSFKVRNGLSFVTGLTDRERARGVVAASTGNHGQGIAYAASLLGVRATVCVPVGNNPEKNAAMRAWGATVVEEGRDYDEALEVMVRLAHERGLAIAHSTNDPRVLAGAATATLEMLEQSGGLDAMVVAVGGGSQSVGALTVARALAPGLRVYGAQTAGAAAIHDSWHARTPMRTARADTFAEGVATRQPYALTFATLCAGLAGFVTVTDAELAAAIRLVLALTHNLVEGAGALGVAAALELRQELRGQRVGVIFSGGNLDSAVLRRILNREF
jgi:threonine dehydratase